MQGNWHGYSKVNTTQQRQYRVAAVFEISVVHCVTQSTVI